MRNLVIRLLVNALALWVAAYFVPGITLSGGIGNVLVVARDQIFLGAAVAQATMFGIALAIRFEESVLLAPLLVYGAGFAHTVVGGVTAITGSLITSASGRGRSRGCRWPTL